MTSSPIRARDRLVADLCARAVSQHSMLCMVSGYAGAGKTWLLRKIAARMFMSSPVAFATADEFEKDAPFSFVERLLGTGLAPFKIIDVHSSPLDVAREIMVGLTAARGPELQTVVVDDAQWIDVESRLVLRYLVPRVMRQGFFIVVAGRLPDMDNASVSYLSDLAESTPQGVDLVLEALSVEEIQALAVDVLGASISRFTATTLRNATGGSFLGIDSIFRRITPQERSNLHLLWDIPIRGVDPLRNPLLTSFVGLTPAARAAVEIVCCADTELTRAAVTEVAGRLGEDVDIELAVAASVLSESGFGSTVTARHSLIAHAVRQTLARDRARAIFRALAPTAHGFRRMWYSLSGASEWNPGLAEAVRDFVDEAIEMRSYESINDVLRRSLDIASGSERQALLIRLAVFNMRNKTVYSLFDLTAEFEALPDSAIKECILLTIMAYRKDQEYPRHRLEEFLRLEAVDPDVRALQAFAAFFSVIEIIRSRDFGTLVPAIATTKAIIARGPADPNEVGDPDLRWMVSPGSAAILLDAFEMLQSVLALDPETVSGLLDDLVPRVLALTPSSHKADALTALAAVAMTLGEIHQARSLAETAVDMLETVEPTWAPGTVRLIHAHATSILGSLDEAAELVDLATETSASTIDVETRLPLSGLHAWLNAARGVPDHIDLDAQTDRQTSMSWQPYAADMVITASCERARAHGEPEAVLAASAPRKVASLVGTQRGFLTYRTHALIDLERLDEAGALIDQLAEQSGKGWQPYWGSLAWLRARLLAARSAPIGRGSAPIERDRVTEVVRLYEEALTDQRFPLPHALTLRDYGIFLASVSRREEARAVLDAALATARSIGAHAYLPGIREALAALSRFDDDLLATLTNRELEIGRLLAQGRSNQEIAAELFVSPATVRYHVSNVLRKLQISRRSEVAKVFRDSGRAV